MQRFQGPLHIAPLLIGRLLAGVDVGIRVMPNLVTFFQDLRRSRWE